MPRGPVIDDHALVVQAVLEGQGVALGWWHLVGRPVQAGLLVQLTGPRAADLRTGGTFHVVRPRSGPLSPQAAAVRDWLAAQGVAAWG